MQGRRGLYYFTGATIACGVAVLLLSLLQSMRPTADVIAAEKAQHPLVAMADFQPGDVRVLKMGGLPVVIWRRNDEDKALAKRQDEAFLFFETSDSTGSRMPVKAKDKNLTVNGEWFLAVAASPYGGCVVLPRTGDFHGFFDPCKGSHFDLAGRWGKGPGGTNLTVVTARIHEDQQHLELDLTNPFVYR